MGTSTAFSEGQQPSGTPSFYPLGVRPAGSPAIAGRPPVPSREHRGHPTPGRHHPATEPLPPRRHFQRLPPRSPPPVAEPWARPRCRCGLVPSHPRPGETRWGLRSPGRATPVLRGQRWGRAGAGGPCRPVSRPAPAAEGRGSPAVRWRDAAFVAQGNWSAGMPVLESPRVKTAHLSKNEKFDSILFFFLTS